LHAKVFEQKTPVEFHTKYPIKLVNTCPVEARGNFIKTLLRMNGIRFIATEQRTRGRPSTTQLQGEVPYVVFSRLESIFGDKLEHLPEIPVEKGQNGPAPLAQTPVLVLGSDACRNL
jgi:hypothetical protein